MPNQRDPRFSPDDVAQEIAERQANEQREAVKRQRDEDDLKWVLSDKRGRRMLASVLAVTGLYQGSFTGNSETFFREGRRSVGLQLLERVNAADPEAYLKMLKEQD
jgi:hypothetical protein